MPQSPSTMILESRKVKSVTVSTFSPGVCHEVMGHAKPDAMILVFWMLSFKPAFSLLAFTFIKRLFSSSYLPAVRVMSSAYLSIKIPENKKLSKENWDLQWGIHKVFVGAISSVFFLWYTKRQRWSKLIFFLKSWDYNSKANTYSWSALRLNELSRLAVQNTYTNYSF